MGRRNKIITGIDVGTTKICAIAAEVDSDGTAVIGFSVRPSHGLKKGVIINMDSTVDAIRGAVEEVETMTGVDIHSAVVGISGSHIKGFSSNGVIPLSSKEVKKSDIQSVMEAAKAIVIPTEREVIQILPQEFIVDDQNGIRDPMGMSGVRLESRVYIATGSVSAAQNIVRCINRSGLKVQDMLLHPLASAEAVLTKDEKELGCAAVDIGGGTAEICVFWKGCIRSCSVLPLGGNQITSDIAIGLRTPISEAEEIKKDFGQASASGGPSAGTLEITSIGGRGARTVESDLLSRIIHARVGEIFGLIRKELDASGMLKLLSGGIVLTGGTALLDGIVDVAEEQVGLPVRIGYPREMDGITDIKSPVYATGTGMMLLSTGGLKNIYKTSGSRKYVWGFGDRMKQWFAEAF